MKKTLLNNRQMGLLSKAFLDNLFPRPHEGELKTGFIITLVNNQDCISFYFQDDYYTKLLNHIQKEYDTGRFSRSNAEYEWNDLLIALRNTKEVNEIPTNEGAKNYWLSIEKTDNQSLTSKKIIVTKEIQGNSMFSFNNETWNFITQVKDGKFSEQNDKYIVELTNGVVLEFPRNEEIVLANMYNKYMSADLKNFEVCELQNNEHGNYLLYRAKKEDIRNTFIISSVGGFMGGSSIWFKVE